MDDLFKKVKKRWALTQGETDWRLNFREVLYADDTVLFAGDVYTVFIILGVLQEHAREYGLELNMTCRAA